MEKITVEILGKNLAIDVDCEQKEVFIRSCQLLNSNLKSLNKDQLSQQSISELLDFAIESVQKDEQINQINQQLDNLLKN